MKKKHVPLPGLPALFCAFLLTLSLSGQAQNFIWGKGLIGSGIVAANALAVDAAGNSYVTGIFNGTATVDFDPSPSGTATLTAVGVSDIFIAKYDPEGNYVWVRSLSGGGSEVVQDIAVDADGNCYLTGQFTGTVDFNPDPATDFSLSGSGSQSMYLAKYDTDGNFVWAFKNEQGTSNGQSLIVDATNHILVTGTYIGTVTFGFGTSNPISLTALGASDLFVAKYEAQSGTLTWITSVGGTGATNRGTDIEVDASGNAYIKGELTGSVDFDPTVGTNIISGSNEQTFLAKYNSAGSYQLAYKIPGGGTVTLLEKNGLAVDNAGNCYVTGAFSGTADFDPSSAVVSLSAVGSNDAFVAKYSTNGNYMWVQPISGTGVDVGIDIVVDVTGNVYLIGAFSGITDFDPSAGVSSLTATGASIFLAKYNSSGGYVWAGKIDNATEYIYSLGLDRFASLYVAGPLVASTDVDPSGNTTILTPNSNFNTFLAKYGECQSITAQPVAGSAVCVGSSATATVGVSGTVSGYQWFHNGTAVTGQTSAILNLTNVQAADVGDYVVVVSGACSLTSSAFSLSLTGSGIIYVTESGSGLQNGTSWANSMPGTSLQLAIDAAGSSCGSRQVWVAAGVYKPTTTTGPNSRTASFSMRNNVAIYGGFVGSETALSGRPALNPVTGPGGASQPSSSTLSGEIGDPNSLTDNSQRVVNNPSSLSLNSSAVLDGFVITRGYNDSFGAGMYNNGSSPTLRNCLFQENTGGGMWNIGSSPTLTDCSFQSNTVNSGGGGIYNQSGSNPSLTNCSFLRNQASYGGGIWNFGNSGPTLTNCSFRYNLVSGSGGGLYNQNNSNVTVTNCVFLSNTATSEGGAIRNTESTVTYTNCIIQNNIALFGGGMRHADMPLTVLNCLFTGNGGRAGGGMYATGNIPVLIRNSSFVNNSSQSTGGAISHSFSTSLILTNCSFQSNSANVANNNGTAWGAVTDGHATFINCVEFGNEQGLAFTQGQSATNSLFSVSSYTQVAISGSNNLTATGTPAAVSPFASTTSTELAPCSPAINAGDPATTTALVGTTDLAGNARFFNAGRIDMGAYEFQGAGLPTSYSVLGSGTATCATSPTITLSGSETGVSYQLLRDGLTNGTAVAGTGSVISFGPQSLSGVYSVLATSSSSCTALMATSTTLTSSTAVPSLSVTPSSSTLTCSSPTVSLSAIGTGTVRWSTGATTPVLPVTAANVYSVTLTGTNGCTAMTSATVVSGTVAATVSVTPSSGTLSCASPTVSLSAIGTGSVLWSTGATSPLISATVAGTYSVTLTNASGCTASASATVTGTVLTSVAVTADGPIGCGRTTATITIQGSGASSYTLVGPSGYSAVNGTGVFVVTAGGSYTGLASQSGCVLSGTVTVSEGGIQPTAMNFRTSGVLGAGNCSVQLLGTATGNRYTVTGPGVDSPSVDSPSGYVYSNVYRVVGTRELVGFVVTKPGTYTLTVYSGSCSATYTTVVGGTACP